MVAKPLSLPPPLPEQGMHREWSSRVMQMEFAHGMLLTSPSLDESGQPRLVIVSRKKLTDSMPRGYPGMNSLRRGNES
jgi:hypothetical protein